MITTVENEYDRAMLEQKKESEKNPILYAVNELVHAWTVNRFNPISGYKHTLEFFQKDSNWEVIQKEVKLLGIPTTAEEWAKVHAAYMSKCRP